MDWQQGNKGRDYWAIEESKENDAGVGRKGGCGNCVQAKFIRDIRKGERKGHDGRKNEEVENMASFMTSYPNTRSDLKIPTIPEGDDPTDDTAIPSVTRSPGWNSISLHQSRYLSFSSLSPPTNRKMGTLKPNFGGLTPAVRPESLMSPKHNLDPYLNTSPQAPSTGRIHLTPNTITLHSTISLHSSHSIAPL